MPLDFLSANGVALSRYGVGIRDLDGLTHDQLIALARQVEALRFSCLWIPEVLGREAFTTAQFTLASTERIVIASGVARALERVPKSAAAAQRGLWSAYPGRYLLGLGVSPASRERGLGPLPFMRRYLDEMEALDLPFPGGAARPPLIIGAYSEGLMRLAGRRSAGLLTVLVDPNHTARARHLVGPDPFLAVSQFAVVETDWPTVLGLGRHALRYYLKLPHQLRKFRALGFTDEDLEPPGSERLVDAMVAWGDPGQVKARFQQHFDAGADHVAIGIVAPHDQVAEQLAQLTPT